MERSRTQSLREVIEAFLKETQLHRKLQERRLVESWYELMGKPVARITSRVYIRKEVLYVQLNSSVLRNELFMMKNDIICRLNDHIGEQVIKDIVFT
jgi:predicted nucleic acid-binding Zn ribbon protein